MCDMNILNRLLVKITDHSKELFGDKLKNVILYGSYARGDFDEESDIDVMVLVDLSPEELANYRWDMSCFGSDLDLKYDVIVSIKLQSLELFEKWKGVLPYYKNVVKEGVVYA